jgi:hypothetical protein
VLLVGMCVTRHNREFYVSDQLCFLFSTKCSAFGSAAAVSAITALLVLSLLALL